MLKQDHHPGFALCCAGTAQPHCSMTMPGADNAPTFSGTFAQIRHPTPCANICAPAFGAAPQECEAMLVKPGIVIAAIFLSSTAAISQGAKLTDPQIAHIAYTAGEIDIKAAKQAIDKASSEEVKQFAEDMVRDHEAVNKQALDLVKKLRVTPEDNDTSKTLSKQASDKLAELGKLKGAAFDKAYIANEVAYHKTVNGALETQLVPSASNAELKGLLQTGLKIFQGHEQHAEHVEAELK
jgi:putative membrane protein